VLIEQVPTVYWYGSTTLYRYSTRRGKGGKGVEVEFAFFFFFDGMKWNVPAVSVISSLSNPTGMIVVIVIIIIPVI